MTRSSVLACTTCFLLGAGAMWVRQEAQQSNDPAAATPAEPQADQQGQATRREPQFENTHVKVWKSIIMPDQPLSLHRHEHGRALIALTEGQLRVLDETGRVTGTYDWQAGKAYWLDADPPGQMHGDRNETGKPIEVIVVELQGDKAGK
jgi:quercetin dioxygenase-like cupin family protein